MKNVIITFSLMITVIMAMTSCNKSVQDKTRNLLYQQLVNEYANVGEVTDVQYKVSLTKCDVDSLIKYCKRFEQSKNKQEKQAHVMYINIKAMEQIALDHMKNENFSDPGMAIAYYFSERASSEMSSKYNNLLDSAQSIIDNCRTDSFRVVSSFEEHSDFGYYRILVNYKVGSGANAKKYERLYIVDGKFEKILLEIGKDSKSKEGKLVYNTLTAFKQDSIFYKNYYYEFTQDKD